MFLDKLQVRQLHWTCESRVVGVAGLVPATWRSPALGEERCRARWLGLERWSRKVTRRQAGSSSYNLWRPVSVHNSHDVLLCMRSIVLYSIELFSDEVKYLRP